MKALLKTIPDYQSTLRVFYSFTVSFYHSTISVLINRQLQSGITFVVHALFVIANCKISNDGVAASLLVWFFLK